MNIKVVGIAYIHDGKLLICKSKRSAKVGKYTLIGGGVEAGETSEEAIIRESKEEINFDLEIDDFYKICNFIDKADSNHELIMHMDVFAYKKDFCHNLKTNDEIIEFRWYDISEDREHLSSSITDHLLPWAIEKGLLYTNKVYQ